MAWVLLVLAGLFEVGMALCLKASDGFSNVRASAAFVFFAVLSFGLLATALRDLPVGTAYAVWTGIGAAGTALLGVALLGDAATPLRLGSIALIVLGVVGLRVGGGAA